MTGIFGTFCTLLFVFFGNEVFAIFVPEQAAYEAGGVFLRIDGYSQLFMMLEITMQGVFYGIGRTIPPAIISISCNYMRIPLAILFVRMGMGVEGIWWAVCVTTVAKGLILLSWFIIIKKKCLSVPSTIKDNYHFPLLTNKGALPSYFNLKSTRLPNNMYLCIVINNAK